MTKQNKTIFFLSLLFFFLASIPLFSQSELALSHKGLITSIIESNGFFYTGAVDGFVIRWDANLNQERLQVSDVEIQKVAVHPDGNIIAIYETDGFSVYRLSVWDWQKKERIYAKRLQEKITSLSFSQKGSYILIGNGNFDGLIILDAVYGIQMQMLNTSIAQVSLVETSATESTLVSYSSNGQFTYASLDDGSIKSIIKTESNLEKGQFLDLNKRFFAGFKNKKFFIIDATNGKTQKTISVEKPILIPGYSNQEFYLIDEVSAENYSLKKISLEKGDTQFEINTESHFDLAVPPSNAVWLAGTIFIGTGDGSLYSLNTSAKFLFAKKETQSSQVQFLDITKDSNSFYILTNEALYRIGENEKELEKIVDNQNWKNILVHNDSVYFWSKGQRDAVVSWNVLENIFQELFIPSQSLENLKVYDSELIALLSSTTVLSYNFQTKKTETLYTGTGINDILLKDESLFISKSAATNPRTPLIEINTKTKETVLLPLTNDFIYALDQDSDKNSPYLYGLSINSNNDSFTTELFYYHKDRKTYASILRLQDENTNAFLTIQESILYTNLGKSDVRVVNLKTNRTQILPKTKALPQKILAIGQKLLVLNQDGTITWYQSNKAIKEWNANISESLRL